MLGVDGRVDVAIVGGDLGDDRSNCHSQARQSQPQWVSRSEMRQDGA